MSKTAQTLRTSSRPGSVTFRHFSSRAVTISGTTITVRKTDGSTTQYTRTGTFTAGADVLTGLD